MSKEFSRLPPKPGQLQINQKQVSLPLEIDKQTEIQGIGMGALKAGNNFKEQARKNFRILAGSALQDFIYTQTGYDPSQQIPAAWQLFHDRVSLVYDSVPPGHFSIFKVIADLIVTLIRGGAPVGP